MQWLLWKVYLRLVCLARLGVIGFSKSQTSPGKSDAKSLGINSKGTIHKVHATSSKSPGKERTIAWKNTSQKSSSAKSLRYEIWGPVPRRDWTTTATRPKLGLESCWKHIQAHRKKDKAAFFFSAEEWVLPAASTKEPEEREFVVDSGASVLMVSKKDLNSAEKTLTLLSWRPWGHREVRRRWWRPMVRCKREKKRRYMWSNWTYSSKLCFLKKLPQCFLGESLRGSWENIPLDQLSKTTSHQKWQENWFHKIQLCAIRSPWFINEFLCNNHTYFFIIFITGFCIWC